MLVTRRFSAPVVAAFIGSNTLGTASTGAVSFNLPAGAAAGDLCVIGQTHNGTDRAYPTGFTSIALTGTRSVAYKVLTAADITAGLVTIPASGGGFNYAFVMGVYRVATSLVLGDDVYVASSPGTSTVIPGFTVTADGDTVGLLGVCYEGSNDATGTPDFPAGWSDRARTPYVGEIAALADLSDIGAYVNGATITVVGLTVGKSNWAAALEFRA